MKPRRKNGSGVSFPFSFQKNGRTGKIKKWQGSFGTYFRFAGRPMRSSFSTFEKAYQHLEREFSKLDSDRSNAVTLHPLNSDVRTYSELEQLLREQANGATLREAVAFFLAHHQHKKFEAKSVSECASVFLLHQKGNNISPGQVKTLEKHYRRFSKDFGARNVHQVSTLEITDWLRRQTDEKTGQRWSVKTRNSCLGSLVSLSLFSRDTLNAIPDFGKTEFQKVRRPKKDDKPAVEIYSPAEIRKLLSTALEHDIEMIPALVMGAFQGLRPAEFHAEGTRRRPLTWEAKLTDEKILHITGQKVRSKANRNIPLHPTTEAWLRPFKCCSGEIWQHKQAYNKKLIVLRKHAGVDSIYDGLRHSYASYRIRQLTGNLDKLAEEMGNSPKEIVDSYKFNVSDAEAAEWFNVMPPEEYDHQVEAYLALRQAA